MTAEMPAGVKTRTWAMVPGACGGATAAMDVLERTVKEAETVPNRTVLAAVKFAEESPELPVEDVYKYAYFNSEKS